ncbi:hypothetical protein Ac2012v2_006595 [Leucoagaricus gongylophorus]
MVGNRLCLFIQHIRMQAQTGSLDSYWTLCDGSYLTGLSALCILLTFALLPVLVHYRFVVQLCLLLLLSYTLVVAYSIFLGLLSSSFLITPMSVDPLLSTQRS